MKLIITVLVLALLLGLTFFLVKRPEADGGLVITSPEMAEIVALVAGVEPIAAVVAECDWPPAMRELPRVGSFGNVELQAVAALRPSLVFTASPSQDALTARLNTLGIAAQSLPLRSVNDLLSAMRHVGELTGNPARATIVADSLAEAFAAVRADTLYAMRVYVEVSPGFWTTSGGSLLGEAVRLAGGAGLFENADWDYAQVAQADVVIADPDVILALYPGVSVADIAARKGWSRVSAVQTGRVFTTDDIDPDLLVRCGPRLPLGVACLKALLRGGEEAAHERP
ncbi:MAG: ABC transporter substrate-binding protein [Candidatus Cloacimonetes bacterium]|nr:ABC transporter substrate-binding protein [Candidatus Cloacimonadota bacterium]